MKTMIKKTVMLLAMVIIAQLSISAHTRNNSSIVLYNFSGKTIEIREGHSSYTLGRGETIKIFVVPGMFSLDIYTISYRHKFKTYKGSKTIWTKPNTKITATIMEDGDIHVRTKARSVATASHYSTSHSVSNSCKHLSNYDYEYLRARLEDTPFDREKVDIFRRSNIGIRYTSYQIADITSLLSFDRYKLELIQEAYPHIVDKNNFYIVYDQLTFNSSKEKLDDFVNSQNECRKRPNDYHYCRH